MRNTAPLLILLCLAGCAVPAPPGPLGNFGAALWPDSQVARDVAAIRAGMDRARATSDRMAARGEP